MLRSASGMVGSAAAAAASDSKGLANLFKWEFKRVFPGCEYKSVFHPIVGKLFILSF